MNETDKSNYVKKIQKQNTTRNTSKLGTTSGDFEEFDGIGESAQRVTEGLMASNRYWSLFSLVVTM